ncbi:HXXEE domain-containing protein [Lactobacillus sp. ESL0791]|uniref:HXXEE domain-containing protein n=1 Tax=Lactobacillus sp. ESL0791 TaxID=2983234 RepID=UPI0023F8F745|nr:HXXEE domain-containing protein [Lactobacillus sp. ESL0791]MDF7639814.1 HXXEE domain-containing protein [Lactobacillus sp. ESL0791]
MAFLTSYWLLPILFMLHDFEELIFVQSWRKTNKAAIHGIKLFAGIKRTDILAGGVSEEFCGYLVVAFAAYQFKAPLLVAAATVPYILHLILHIIFPLTTRSYIPGCVTAIVELPLVSAYLYAIIKLTFASINQWFFAICLMTIIFASNLVFIHWAMRKILERLEDHN